MTGTTDRSAAWTPTASAPRSYWTGLARGEETVATAICGDKQHHEFLGLLPVP